MAKMRKLNLNREALAELSSDELGSVAGGNTGVCIAYTYVCVSVYNCITEEYTCLCWD